MKNRIIALVLALLLIAPLPVYAETNAKEVPPVIGEFATTDIYGASFDQSILQNADLTFINVWGTFCPPCIDEMPHLGKLATEFEGSIQFIGLVADVYTANGIDQSLVELAIEIAEQTGAANYTHLVPSIELVQLPLSALRAYPTSFCVDKDGRLVGGIYEGGHTEDEWRQILLKTQSLVTDD